MRLGRGQRPEMGGGGEGASGDAGINVCGEMTKHWRGFVSSRSKMNGGRIFWLSRGDFRRSWVLVLLS